MGVSLGLDTLLLDAGGVLVHPSFTRLGAALARHGVRVDAAALARAEPHVKRELDVTPRMQATNDASRASFYFDRMLARAGVALSAATAAAIAEVQAYHARENLWEDVPAEVVPALARRRAAGLRLVVVSNANGRLRAAFRRIGLAAHVDDIIDSFEVGCEKPDPAIFRLALARAATRPERALHVGDLYHVDVVGARRAGVRGVLLDAAGLYGDHDCPRVATLTALADLIEAGDARSFGPPPAVPP
ncbi:MAG: HAD-IA family hydrolase [Deltaproteobacteria bacterium]|nr:HAD-IA family hydrolase [Deltaproteobacteria bacterium]